MRAPRTVRLLGAVMAVAALLAAPSRAAEDIPLETQGTSLVVEATLNNFTGRFLLDTGATYCVVSKDVARRAKIRGRVSGGSVRLATVDGAVDASLGRARKIEVGRSAARDVEVAVIDDDPVHGLDGILGLSFLNNFRYTVDLDAGTLRLDR